MERPSVGKIQKAQRELNRLPTTEQMTGLWGFRAWAREHPVMAGTAGGFSLLLPILVEAASPGMGGPTVAGEGAFGVLLEGVLQDHFRDRRSRAETVLRVSKMTPGELAKFNSDEALAQHERESRSRGESAYHDRVKAHAREDRRRDSNP